MNLRVLMVSAAYFPSLGGVETHVHEAALRLASMGISVEVLATDLSGRLPVHEEHDGIEVRRVRAFPEGRDWRFAPGIDKAIGQGKWDVIHCQGYHTLVAPIALAAAWRRSIPSVLTFHSGGASTPLRSAIRRVQLLLLRPLVRHARALLAVSEFERESLAAALHLSRERFVVIPNGSELPRPDLTPNDDARDTLVLSIGRLVRYKGHHRAIAAMPDLLRERPDARLEIVGAGPDEAELRQQIEDLGLEKRVRIRAIPGADRQAMANLVGMADLVTLLSEYESQGIAALEAITLGRKVLVADTSALSELARDGRARAVPLDASPAETARAILESLEDPPPSVAVSPWTWDDCANELAAVYRRVAEAR